MLDSSVIKRLNEFFEGDFKKVELWFNTPNSLLGGISPLRMIILRNGKKLEQFINSMLDGELP